MNNPLMPPSWMMTIVEGRGSGTLQTHTRHFGNYCALFPLCLRGDIRKNEGILRLGSLRQPTNKCGEKKILSLTQSITLILLQLS